MYALLKFPVTFLLSFCSLYFQQILVALLREYTAYFISLLLLFISYFYSKVYKAYIVVEHNHSGGKSEI